MVGRRALRILCRGTEFNADILPECKKRGCRRLHGGRPILFPFPSPSELPGGGRARQRESSPETSLHRPITRPIEPARPTSAIDNTLAWLPAGGSGPSPAGSLPRSFSEGPARLPVAAAPPLTARRKSLLAVVLLLPQSKIQASAHIGPYIFHPCRGSGPATR